MPIYSYRKPLIFAAILSVISIAAALGGPRVAQAELDKPSGNVILVVAGRIGETNIGDEAHFDFDMLMALGTEELRTTTPFEEGEQSFEGIRVEALLQRVEASGNTLVATALDGYTVEIPIKDMVDYPVLMATKRNGQKMGVRNKGPIWIVYPIDQFPELVGEKYSARSVWQLNRIEVR